MIVTACPEYRYRMVLEPLMVVAVTTSLITVFQRRIIYSLKKLSDKLHRENA